MLDLSYNSKDISNFTHPGMQVTVVDPANPVHSQMTVLQGPLVF